MMTTGTIKPQGGKALRVLRYPLVLAVLEFVLIVVLATLANSIVHRTLYAKGTPLDTLGALAVAVATMGSYMLCRQAIEGYRGEHEFAAGASLKELFGGILLGFGLFALAAGLVALAGSFAITGTRWPGELWAMLGMAIVSGVTEEVLFRGVLFRHLETLIGSWGALAITSAFFGLAHLANPHSSAFAALAIALEAGVMLGAAYMLTRRLWLPIGIHAAWNFTQGWVFSVPVSGSKPPLGLFVSRLNGPDWLTGGAFGLEASVVALAVATLTGVILLRLAMRRGQLVAPVWVRKLG